MNVLQSTAILIAIMFALALILLTDAKAGDPHHEIPEPVVINNITEEHITNEYTSITKIHNQVIKQYECDARGSADPDFTYATRSVQVGVAGAKCFDSGQGEASIGLGFRGCKNCGLGKILLSNGKGGKILSGAYTMTLR